MNAAALRLPLFWALEKPCALWNRRSIISHQVRAEPTSDGPDLLKKSSTSRPAASGCNVGQVGAKGAIPTAHSEWPSAILTQLI